MPQKNVKRIRVKATSEWTFKVTPAQFYGVLVVIVVLLGGSLKVGYGWARYEASAEMATHTEADLDKKIKDEQFHREQAEKIRILEEVTKKRERELEILNDNLQLRQLPQKPQVLILVSPKRGSR